MYAQAYLYRHVHRHVCRHGHIHVCRHVHEHACRHACRHVCRQACRCASGRHEMERSIEYPMEHSMEFSMEHSIEHSMECSMEHLMTYQRQARGATSERLVATAMRRPRAREESSRGNGRADDSAHAINAGRPVCGHAYRHACRQLNRHARIDMCIAAHGGAGDECCLGQSKVLWRRRHSRPLRSKPYSQQSAMHTATCCTGRHIHSHVLHRQAYTQPVLRSLYRP